MAFGTLGVVKRWALVSARPRRAGSRVAVAAVVLAVVAGVVLVGRVLSADPVGYGVPVWPFADAGDRAEGRVMSSVVDAARAADGLSGVVGAVRAGDVEVVRASSLRGGSVVWMVVRLTVPGVGVRCREVVVQGAVPVEVNSRRVLC